MGTTKIEGGAYSVNQTRVSAAAEPQLLSKEEILAVAKDLSDRLDAAANNQYERSLIIGVMNSLNCV